MNKTKAFFKAFVITFLIMAAVGIVVLSDIPDLSVPKQNESSREKKAEFTPTAEDNFNLLLMLSAKPDKAPYAYFILNFDGPQRRLNIVRLPERARLSNESESKIILSEQFEKGAAPRALRAISQHFDCKLSRYILIDNSRLNSLFMLFDPTEIVVSQNLSQIDEENEIFIKIDKGKRLLSSSAMVDFISATAWQGGAEQALFESANAICAFLNQNGEDIFKDSSCKLEKYILNSTTNNFSVMDFEKKRELVHYILSSKNAARAGAISGESKTADTEFVINEDSFLKIQKMLKNG